MALIITPNGTQRATERKRMGLEELQELVGGYIEVVRTPALGFTWVVVNEEGIGLGLAYNKEASELANRPLLGTAVFCMIDEID